MLFALLNSENSYAEAKNQKIQQLTPRAKKEVVMNWSINTLKRVGYAVLLTSSLMLGLAQITSAQNPYWYGRSDQQSLKRHEKEEKRELKRHQKLEREEFGNSAELRRHQKEEQRELNRHQKREKRRDRWTWPY